MIKNLNLTKRQLVLLSNAMECQIRNYTKSVPNEVLTEEVELYNLISDRNISVDVDTIREYWVDTLCEVTDREIFDKEECKIDLEKRVPWRAKYRRG